MVDVDKHSCQAQALITGPVHVWCACNQGNQHDITAEDKLQTVTSPQRTLRLMVGWKESNLIWEFTNVLCATSVTGEECCSTNTTLEESLRDTWRGETDIYNTFTLIWMSHFASIWFIIYTLFSLWTENRVMNTWCIIYYFHQCKRQTKEKCSWSR